MRTKAEAYPLTGVWIVYYSDRSGAWVFDSELEALRLAVEKSATVKFVNWGGEIF